MKTVLVLNASYEPLSVVDINRAITLLVLGKASVLEDTGIPFSSAHEMYMTPSVIRLNYMVPMPRKLTVPFSRRALFARDEYTCQYCATVATKDNTMEVEHVVPRSRGGRNSWENTVTACRDCNGRKADRTPAEAGMELLRKPFAPTRRAMIATRGNETWDKYLQ